MVLLILACLPQFVAVGYGDKVPITLMGRFLACIWMVIGILLFGMFNAAIIVSLQAPPAPWELTGPGDENVAGMKICTTTGSFEEWLKMYGLGGSNIYFADDSVACYNRLMRKEV